MLGVVIEFLAGVLSAMFVLEGFLPILDMKRRCWAFVNILDHFMVHIRA